METDRQLVRVDVVVVGAGQAGLAMGQQLEGLRVAIVDGADDVGASWRPRWDSLQLFTPARYSSSPGLPFGGAPDRHPTKDDVADYLVRYAQHFDLPVHLGRAVIGVAKHDGGFVVDTKDGTRYKAGQVVVATGPFQVPVRPPAADGLASQVVQLHSHDYRNPDDIPADGTVAVVGRGNSGAQIAAELATAGRRVVVSGRPQPHLPQRLCGRDIFWWLHRLRLLHAPTSSIRGRLLRRRGEPVIGTDLATPARAGRIRLAGRVEHADGCRLRFSDGTDEEVAAVVWATGYRRSFPWLRLPVLNHDGQPVHRHGVTDAHGLYFLGLPWQSQRGSALLDGVGHDAARLARLIRARADTPVRHRP